MGRMSAAGGLAVRRAVAAIGLLVLAVPGRPGAQMFRSNVDLVSLGVNVVDKRGALVADLAQTEFEVYEDGKRQELTFFSRGGDSTSAAELHLGLLFDTSGSMDEDIALARTAAVKFLNALPEAVDVTLVDFDTEVRVARYGQNDFARLIERIRRRRPDGMTAMYDALGVYLHGAASQEGRKILVAYSDAGDNRSSLNLPDVIELLQASDVTMYTIGFLDHLGSSHQLDARSRIQRLSAPTGGQAFFPSSVKDIESAYDKVLADIKAQYALGYVSTNTRADGTWRKVDIKVTRPGLKTRSRQGYFAPYRKSP
ncbi:MAG: VWA domain-containing protein [Acidobacteria bacterium]|nr:VWA domain-containing protein [Acidobacteriota bacterium]